MTRKNRGVKIMAFLALFGIIIGVVGTGLLIIFSPTSQEEVQQELTPEQMIELQNFIDSQTGAIEE